MKKNYVKPSVEVIKVNVVNMLANSLQNFPEELPSIEQKSREESKSAFGNIWDRQW